MLKTWIGAVGMVLAAATSLWAASDGEQAARPPTVDQAGFAASRRVALVIGNREYMDLRRLRTPVNDAADVGVALARLGFEVTVARDVTRSALRDALRTFARRSAGAEVALVFYAGHGVALDGQSYLVPVDARLRRDVDAVFETVALDEVLAAAVAAARLVILDVCPCRVRRRAGADVEERESQRFGWFPPQPAEETLMVLAETVDSGPWRNSPYAAALLEHLEQSLDLETLFRRVRRQLHAATGLRMAVYSALSGPLALRPVD